MLEMKKFVSDYLMHLIEARKNELKLHNINNRDLFNLLAILLNRSGKLSETRQKAIDYATEHEVEETVIMTAAGAANCKINYNELDKGGEVNMISVFEETRLEGINQGRAEGMLEGRIQVYHNLRKRGFSKEEALAIADIPVSALENKTAE